MIGGILVKLAFVACLVSVLAYYQHHRKGELQMLKLGRAFYHATVVLVMVISAVLLYFILTHQFQYTYVWNYSSRELSLPLLISTFYAGQEGSFMLWELYTALIGVFLLAYSSRKGYEAQVMTVFGLINLMLLLMLLVKNPFMYVWESWPGQVEAGFVPPNGRGLNPLLQNYWMVIHPQILFTGFAAMGVPYAYAVAAMMKRDYRNWIRPATPWIVFGSLQLGTGIMLGGFWAYETLGWGGYWGWDPVENSSLVPWLISIGAIHTILSQRKSGAFVKTNLALAMLCFVFVLYSTFLTRSGVLGDTSVHSFVDPGMWAYWILVGMMTFFVGLGFGLLLKRMREMPRVPVEHSYMSREFALFLGSAAVVFAALFTIVGTSAPIITQILQGKVTAVDISYYVQTTLPLGIAVGLLSGIGQLLWWNRSKRSEFFRSLAVPALLGLVFTLAMMYFGLNDVLVGLFVFGAAFALFANIQVGWTIIKGNPKYAGGSIAHIGLAVMFLGFVSSEKYDSKQTLSLVQGVPMDALGYTLTYTGHRPIDNEKFAFEIKVEKKGEERQVIAPIMYFSSYTNGLMRNPDIANFVTHDFYIAPVALEQKESASSGKGEKATLRKGETKRMGELEISFVDFVFPLIERASTLASREMQVGARLRVKENGQAPVEVIPSRMIVDGEEKDSPGQYKSRYLFTIADMKADRESPANSYVTISVVDVQNPADAPEEAGGDVFIVEASIKPFINLVWSGVLILLLGFIITIVRRAQEAASREVPSE